MYINFWYPIALSKDITNEKPLEVQVMGLKFAAFRDTAGAAHVISNTCIHRGGALGRGKIKGDSVACPYHGCEFDAEGKVLGRLAVRVADILRGKNKPIYSPHMNTGDSVVLINADKVAVTGRKKTDKLYHRYSGYPGGITSITLRDQLRRFPERVIRAAVWGMLPHNKMGRHVLKRLKVFAGAEHPYPLNTLKVIK